MGDLTVDLTGARDLVARCLGLWTREGFHLQHLYGLRAAAYCDLYADNPAPSHARLAAAWPALKGSGLLRVPLARTDAVSVRSRVAIATLDGNRTTRPGLLRAVARDARRLSGMGRIDATVHAHLLLAACAVRHGRRDNVLTHLEAAIQAATTYEMRLHAAVARWRKGEIVGGSVGRELCLAAADDLTRAGIARPDRWVALYAPGFTSPATDPARTVDTPLP